jgi:putative aldouronate transport system substrate-binding protein
MKIRGMLRRNTAVWITALAIVLGLTACQSGNQSGGQSASPSASTSPSASASSSPESTPALEPVTLTVWENSGIMPEGEQTDAIAQELKKKFNVTLKVVGVDDTKEGVLLASGDLPDILRVTPKFKEQIMNSKLLLPLDDLIQSNGQEIQKNLGKSVEYSRKFMSTDGKLYVLMQHAATSFDQLVNNTPPFEHYYGAITRWDYYKELGYPVLKNSDDFLNLLADMVKNHPETADGKKVYGVAMNTDWGLWPWNAPAYMLDGTFQVGASNNIAVDNDGNLSDGLADENASFFSNSLKFYNKAYQMGLLDPESFTQKSDAVTAKIINGQVLSWTNAWSHAEINVGLQKVNPSAAMVLIPGGFPKAFKGGASAIGWTGQGIGISAKSKNPERAMDVLNYFASYEGNRLASSGVKGVHWDVIDGKTQMKPEYFTEIKSDPDYVKKNGFGGGQGTLYSHLMLMDSTVFNPEDETPIDLTITREAAIAQMNPAQKEYADYYKGAYPGEAYENAIGKENVYLANTLVSGSIGALPEDIKRINEAVANALTKSITKIVMSKTDEEFSKNVQAAISEFKGLGIEKANEWFKTEYAKAKEATAGME